MTDREEGRAAARQESLLQLHQERLHGRRWGLRNAAGFSSAIVLIALCVTPSAFAEAEVSHSTINAGMGYGSTSQGDPLAKSGARVTVSAEGADAAAHGGIIYRTDAQHWAGKVVRLSAHIDASRPEAKPALWLRADAGPGKPLAFASSAQSRVAADGHMDIDMRVPAEAVSLAFGVVMQGPGQASAEGLTLAQSDRDLPASEASARQVYEAARKIVLSNAYWSSRLGNGGRSSELSNAAGTGYQAGAAIRALLRELGDSHSFYQGAEEAKRYASSGATSDSADVRLLDGDIGYLQLPGIRGTDPAMAREFAVRVAARMQDVGAKARCGWVVDLRKDRGGNMWPMVSALGMFFGSERLGGFKAADGSIRWWSTGSPSVIPVPGASTARGTRISVLLGPDTASSGEAVAVAFIGRENTRSFGAPTNGRASANTSFHLPDGGMIYLTTAVDVDRFGRAVGDRIAPDVPLAYDIVSSRDVPAEAQRWLVSSCRY